MRRFGTKFKMLKKSVLQIVALAWIMISSACQESYSDCPQYDIPYLRCAFTYTDTVTVDTFIVMVSGLSDTVYNGSTPPSTLEVPVDPDASYIDISLLFAPDTIDYMRISYTTDYSFSSPDCGIIANFEIDFSASTFTTLQIDSVYALSPYIDENLYDNIEIYY